MKKNTNSNTTTATVPAVDTPTQEKKPDFYARLLTHTPADKAAGILAALCRRKDYAIRRVIADHENGIGFDDAVKALAEVYKPREARS
ncbi:MAG TPA: hypothetical protein DCZ95_07530 [Verrucomicrobia bacterium]|nr:MAG: hypothetical protein A2X46_16415 [Lentisphaerae bacterium GWF2_57_35]HBA83926.1 hypothetical protein [Verrucomicrobiota bacterium]